MYSSAEAVSSSGCLAPVLLLFIVLTAFFHPQWSLGTTGIIGGLDVLAVLMIFALYSPKRFHWAGRAATGLVFLAFLIYLMDEIAEEVAIRGALDPVRNQAR